MTVKNNQKLEKNWQTNNNLLLELEFNNFKEVIEAVNKIAKVAEKLNHHPNLYIYDYKKLKIMLYTHDAQEITEKDYQLAEEIEKIL
jgi:4a-hydroxytetrahydrobiopterin dehydratase